MKKLFALALICCLLTGCSSLLEREYSSVEAHSSKYWEGASGALRAETYQDVVNDLLLLVGQHSESGVIRLYDYKGAKSVSDTLEQATTEVQQTPLGAFAVEYITSTSQALRGYYEITLSLSYRRTSEQLQAMVNATSTKALHALLTGALAAEKTELAVRIGYFKEERAQVAEIVAAVRAEAGLAQSAPWIISYYPNADSAGIIEFSWADGESDAKITA